MTFKSYLKSSEMSRFVSSGLMYRFPQLPDIGRMPHLYLAPPYGVTPSKFRKEMSSTGKSRMMALPCTKESMMVY